MALELEFLRALEGHAAAVYALAGERDADGRALPTVLAGAGDGLVVRWRLDAEDRAESPAGRALARLPAHVMSLCAPPGGAELLAGSLDGGLYLLERAGEGYREARNLGDARSAVFALHWGPGRLWVGHGDGTLTAWDPDGWRPLGRRALSADRIRALAPEPGGAGRLAVTTSGGAVLLTDAEGRVRQTLAHGERAVFSAAWHPSGRYLLTGGMDAHLRVWDASGETLVPAQALPAHLFTINAIAFDPTGRWFATASRDKTVKLWDADTIGLARVIERPRYRGHRHSVNALHWSPWAGPDGAPVLVSGSDDRTVRLWTFTERPG